MYADLFLNAIGLGDQPFFIMLCVCVFEWVFLFVMPPFIYIFDFLVCVCALLLLLFLQDLVNYEKALFGFDVNYITFNNSFYV